MSGSARYVGALEALRELFTCYPCNAEMSSITLAAEPSGQPPVTIKLREATPGELGAGIIEWRRTLTGTKLWAWRTPAGHEAHLAIIGFAPECDTVPVAVVAGPIPYDDRLGVDLAAGTPEELDDTALYTWFGTQIAYTWPFRTTPTKGATS